MTTDLRITPNLFTVMPISSLWGRTAISPLAQPPRVTALLPQFKPISLTQMNNVSLLNRADTKYVLTEAQLYDALRTLTHRYSILEIGATRLHGYETLYFDTPDFALYQRHHAGAKNRYKVRSRTYLETCQSFLEIKFKSNTNRTIKDRVPTPALITEFAADTDDFMQSHFPYDARTLEPKLWNTFSRITLVSVEHQERLTLDLNVNFHYEDAEVTLPGIVIAEVKQADRRTPSDFVEAMRNYHVRPSSFSKYSIGASLLYPDLKHNKFKAEHRLLAKLIQECPHD